MVRVMVRVIRVRVMVRVTDYSSKAKSTIHLIHFSTLYIFKQKGLGVSNK